MSPRAIEFPIAGLTDGVVAVRPIADADLPAIVDAAQDPEISRFTRVPNPYGEADARQFQRSTETGMAAGAEFTGVIVDATSGRLLGTLGLHSIDTANRRCSAGYWVAAAQRGRGIARRALALACRFGFEELGLERIEVWIEPANLPSLRVAEAVGFKREGLLRSFAEVNGQRRDMLMYSLLRGDLR